MDAYSAELCPWFVDPAHVLRDSLLRVVSKGSGQTLSENCEPWAKTVTDLWDFDGLAKPVKGRATPYDRRHRTRDKLTPLRNLWTGALH